MRHRLQPWRTVKVNPPPQRPGFAVAFRTDGEPDSRVGGRRRSLGPARRPVDPRGRSRGGAALRRARV